ncbi:hypothetical protein NL676_035044 [Syzygium grande]|nr:hypothetical protein NL676_035044 [Syzygium grande]
MQAGGQSKRTFLPFGHKTKHLPVKPTPPSSRTGHATGHPEKMQQQNHPLQIQPAAADNHQTNPTESINQQPPLATRESNVHTRTVGVKPTKSQLLWAQLNLQNLTSRKGTGGVSVNKRATLRTLQNPHLRKAGLFTRGKKSQRISRSRAYSLCL